MSAGPYLIDTNLLLWAWHEPHKVPRRYADILSLDGQFFVSLATIWEISIKVSIGKLVTVPRVTEAIRDTGYAVLPISAEHAEATRHLPLHHRDPFDRMIIAQAMLEGMMVLATDRRFRRYDVAIA